MKTYSHSLLKAPSSSSGARLFYKWVRYGCLMLLVLVQLNVLAQQHEADSLPERIEIPATQVPKPEVMKIGKIIPDSATGQDLIMLRAALDSLKGKALTSAALAHKTDSLLQLFTKNRQYLQKIKNAEQQANKMTEDLTADIAQKALPEQAQKTLKKVGEAKQQLTTSGALLPQNSTQPPLPNTGLQQVANLTNLPKPENVKGLAGQYAAATAIKATTKALPGHQKELRVAQRELGQYKRNFEQAKVLKDSSKTFFRLGHLPNKALLGRIILGSLWQLGKHQQYFLDVSPYLAWQFNNFLTAGAGFQYRINLNPEHKPWIKTADKVMGAYAFSDINIKKGFFGRLHYETLSAPVPRPNPINQADDLAREWVKGLSVGLGKSYSIYKKIKGYGLMQYNILYTAKETPYMSPLQVKAGFYINKN